MEERIKIAYDSAVADSAKDVLNADTVRNRLRNYMKY